MGVSGVPGLVGDSVGEPDSAGVGDVGISSVRREARPVAGRARDVVEAAAGEGTGGNERGSRFVGEGLMKREISSGVVAGVTPSTRVQEGRRIMVVVCCLSEPVDWGGCMLDAEIINRCFLTASVSGVCPVSPRERENIRHHDCPPVPY